MPDSRPLHVQVAAAMGWSEMYDRGDSLWLGKNPDSGLVLEVPPYGRSWCATGPFVERFGIGVDMTHPYFVTQHKSPPWQASVELGVDEDGTPEVFEVGGGTPCEAICRLIVKLHSEGKLVKK